VFKIHKIPLKGNKYILYMCVCGPDMAKLTRTALQHQQQRTAAYTTLKFTFRNK